MQYLLCLKDAGNAMVRIYDGFKGGKMLLNHFPIFTSEGNNVA